MRFADSHPTTAHHTQPGVLVCVAWSKQLPNTRFKPTSRDEKCFEDSKLTNPKVPSGTKRQNRTNCWHAGAKAAKCLDKSSQHRACSCPKQLYRLQVNAAAQHRAHAASNTKTKQQMGLITLDMWTCALFLERKDPPTQPTHPTSQQASPAASQPMKPQATPRKKPLPLQERNAKHIANQHIGS